MNEDIERVSIDELNTDTSNLTIVYYPPYAAGVTLATMLALNDNSLFMNRELALLQMEGNFNVNEKINWLTDKLGQLGKGKRWNDLDLSVHNFAGLLMDDYAENTDLRFFKLIKDISFSNYRFFHKCHSKTNLTAMVNVWKNAKIVIIENPQRLVSSRMSNNANVLNMAKFINDIPKIKQFKQELYTFNANAFFDEQKLLYAVEKLYNDLNLPNFNGIAISNYYKVWFQKMSEMSQ